MDFDGLDDYVKQGITDKEIEENCDYFKNHPLFMNEVPENYQENDMLMGISSIVNNDSPENLAKSMNEKANQMMKEHMKDQDNDYWLKKALMIYSDGIAQKCTDIQLNAKLYSNRALVQFKRKNYGKCIDDCKQSLELDPEFLKPRYRMAQAHFMVQKYQESLDDIALFLKQDPKNKECIQLKNQVTAEFDKKKEKLRKEKEEQLFIDSDINQLCTKNNVKLVNRTIDFPAAQQNQIRVLENGEIGCPIMIYYPQFHNSDFIQLSHQTDSLADHLQQCLPLPWDNEQHYQLQNIVSFVEVTKKNKKVFKRVDPNKTVLEILQTKNYQVPKLLEIYILSIKSPYFKIFIESNDVKK